MAPKGSVVDLFCGAGGFSLGAALTGFDILGSIDLDETLTSSYRTNFPSANLIHADISAIEPSAIAMKIAGGRRVDVVVGGPPCQGFSHIGARQTLDARNQLLVHFFRQVAGLSPRCFVMENVPGLLDGPGRGLLEDGIALLNSRYKIVGPFIVDAANFGAATRRRRVLVVGYDPADVDPISEEMLRSCGTRSATTVKDAIRDLPEPRSDLDKNDLGWWKFDGRHRRLSEYARWARTAPIEGLGDAIAKERLRAGLVSGLHDTTHTPNVQARFAATRTGGEDPVSRYPRLEWEGQSRTLRAGTGSERGAFQSMRPIHPEKARVISVREGARLQGFPDWFVFHRTKWHSFRMIGNSVSPVLSRAIFSYLSERLGVLGAKSAESSSAGPPQRETKASPTKGIESCLEATG
ncbi:DNA cytosine methyltransferase [Roseomonas hellenica]|uniref:Cytosine-specific methyltransferase n=1 Tax=Plastoroseomonas hellenica TaxID=2687306 RepID=A0ABS5F1X0_9PROT|nr:DNA cytosine methyltransferase [Plastoroseomonas hellenica]MBR0666120.1 DNA cytosine methyltransferase [Plastoroseomonas hellenica]